MVLRNILEDYWRKIHHRGVAMRRSKPRSILQPQPLGTEWAWENYREKVYNAQRIDEQDFATQADELPGRILAYKRRLWSYRDFPCVLVNWAW